MVSGASTGVCCDDFGFNCIRGICSGVPSNSAQPPRSPISTILCKTRESSSFLLCKIIVNIMALKYARDTRTFAFHTAFHPPTVFQFLLPASSIPSLESLMSQVDHQRHHAV